MLADPTANRLTWASICFAAAVIPGLFLSSAPDVVAQDSDAKGRATYAWPGEQWERAEPGDVGMDQTPLRKARDYALTGDGSGVVTRQGKLVLSWGDTGRRYDLKSTTKSIGVTALGLALKDGKLKLSDKGTDHHPGFGVPPKENREQGWADEVTILHLATQTAGFEKPGGYSKLLFRPGTKWDYSDSGPNWLAECVTLEYRRDLQELMFDRVFTPLGIERDDLRWRDNSYRPKSLEGVPNREFGSGISANVDAMARIGYLYLRRGRWRDQEIVSADFVDRCRGTVPAVVGLEEHDDGHGNASEHYGLLWWNNADGTLADVPRDAYWSWGLYDSLILVVPSLDLVVARAGRSWQRNGAGHYDVLRPFFQPIVASVTDTAKKGDRASEQESREPETCRAEGESSEDDDETPRIRAVRWAPEATIVRRAAGSDNWPMTWADDGHQYTAYGDGWGFQPRVEKKLSLGVARIEGAAESFKGVNIRSPSIERTGQGANGPKASGILMVDGTLYLFIRNVDNSQLAWSDDRGRNWTWADWRFTESFGAPTPLNFGRNYAGAIDDYVYVYSFDNDSAYKPADRMVLARVDRSKIKQRTAYRFFAGMRQGEPTWSTDIEDRQAVMSEQGSCYRSGVSYNAPLERFLWVQTRGGTDTRHQGGLALFEARRPWGPWHEVYRDDDWDVGPGETACFPTKWISDDGRSLYLVFSGNDAFSVRRASLDIR